MKKITILETEYEIIEDDAKVIDKEEIESYMTEYFTPYDYVLGDYSYGKLRLKGFFEDSNKKSTAINKFSGITINTITIFNTNSFSVYTN